MATIKKAAPKKTAAPHKEPAHHAPAVPHKEAHNPAANHHIPPPLPKTGVHAIDKAPGAENPQLKDHVLHCKDMLTGMGIKSYNAVVNVVMADIRNGRIDTKLTGDQAKAEIENILK